MPLRKNERRFRAAGAVPGGSPNKEGAVMAEQKAPAATEADEAESRLFEAVFGEGRSDDEAEVDDADAMRAILAEMQQAAALRMWVQSSGEFDADEQAVYGINADGTIPEGGLTDAGKAFAHRVVHHVVEAFEKADSRQRRKAEPAADGPGRLLVDALGLRGPLRAAIRMGAATLASALEDDEDEDDGGEDDGGEDDGGEGSAGHSAHGHTDAGTCLHTVRLGAEPYVLLRASRVAGAKVGAVTLTAGGGAFYGSRGGDGPISVERMLDVAVQGVEQYGDRAESSLDPEVISEMLRTGFGVRTADDGTLRPKQPVGFGQPNTQRGRSRLHFGEPVAGDPGDVSASSGPSTEMPTMPQWPAQEPGAPGEAPCSPPRTGESCAPQPAAPPSSGDDGGGSPSPSPSSGGGE